MDIPAALTAFTQQLRRNPTPDTDDAHIERDDIVVRAMSATDGWTGVTFAELNDDNADDVIAAQIRRFAVQGRPWEWKHYSYDAPVDLPQRLLTAGFTPQPPETLLVADLTTLDLDTPPPSGITVRPVSDEATVNDLVSVHEQAFGGDHSATGRVLLAALHRQPSTNAAAVAYAQDTPISSGRLEFYPGSDFAALWGGGTVPAWRGRGVFRALVSYRAALARAAGYRYLQVDATDDSCPILKRLGFHELAITTPYIHAG
jgi:GNAT superfamily N-acetyltransferase